VTTQLFAKNTEMYYDSIKETKQWRRFDKINLFISITRDVYFKLSVTCAHAHIHMRSWL